MSIKILSPLEAELVHIPIVPIIRSTIKLPILDRYQTAAISNRNKQYPTEANALKSVESLRVAID